MIADIEQMFDGTGPDQGPDDRQSDPSFFHPFRAASPTGNG